MCQPSARSKMSTIRPPAQYHLLRSEERAVKSGQGKPSPYKSTGMERPKPAALLHQTLLP